MADSPSEVVFETPVVKQWGTLSDSTSEAACEILLLVLSEDLLGSPSKVMLKTLLVMLIEGFVALAVGVGIGDCVCDSVGDCLSEFLLPKEGLFWFRSKSLS